MAALSAPVESKKSDRRRVSCETLCSSNSSCVLQKRKPVHPLATSVKTRSGGNSIKQRVLSAKFLRFKTLQNELNDANYHITQLINENKLLKTIQKRQDQALARYEGANAELPKVLESHQEETRVLQSRNKILRKNIKELNEQIKSKDEEINNLKDQNKHLMSLCKNKNLEERGKLSKKLEEYEILLKERDSTISTLNRKIALETKNCKFKIKAEANKNKQLQRELLKATSQVDHLTSLLEGREKSADKKIHRNISNERKKEFLIKLEEKEVKLIASDSKFDETDEKFRVPYERKVESNNSSTSILNSSDETESCSSTSNLNTQENGQDQSLEKRQNETVLNSDSSSSVQLRNVVNSWQKKNTKADNVKESLNEYYTDIIETAQTMNKTVDRNFQEFESAAKETESLMSALKENDEISSKLSSLTISPSKTPVFDYTDFFKNTNKNQNSENVLLNSFESQATNSANFESTLNTFKVVRMNSEKPEVGVEDKEKLLAKLRAIDNGETIEFTKVKRTKNDLLKELFG